MICNIETWYFGEKGCLTCLYKRAYSAFKFSEKNCPDYFQANLPEIRGKVERGISLIYKGLEARGIDLTQCQDPLINEGIQSIMEAIAVFPKKQE